MLRKLWSRLREWIDSREPRGLQISLGGPFEVEYGVYYLFVVDSKGHLRIAPQTGSVEHRSLLLGKQLMFAAGEALFEEGGSVSLNDECSEWEPGEARAKRFAAAIKLFEALGYRVCAERLRPFASGASPIQSH